MNLRPRSWSGKTKKSWLLNCNFSSSDGFTAEGADFAGFEVDDAVTGGVNREVAADFGADAATLGHADLANDNLAGFDLLATRNLDPEALAWAIVDVFGGTAGFDV